MGEKIVKVLINASILRVQNTGLGVYTYYVLKYVCPLLERYNIDFDILCSTKDVLPKNCVKHCVTIDYSNYFERNLKTIKVAKGYDLIWSTTQHGTETSKKQIITIHDVIPLIYPKGRMHQWIYYKFILKRYINKSTKIFTVSESTKKDIVKFYKCPQEKIKVLYEAIENKDKFIENSEQLLDHYNVEKQKYFVIVGIHYPYKNIHSVITAFKKFEELKDYKLVIIGKDKGKYGKSLKTLVEKYNLKNSIFFTGFTSEEEKNTLLNNCIASVYPTLYEGFGLPLLEAMQIGVPVMSSNLSSLSEVGGDAVLYFNPLDVEDIKNKMLYVATDSKIRDELIVKGKQNLARFEWKNIAEKMASEICHVLKDEK